jgi:hypothetical protein
LRGCINILGREDIPVGAGDKLLNIDCEYIYVIEGQGPGARSELSDLFDVRQKELGTSKGTIIII